ncbi:uncharacterized protein LOC124171249 [Ischnura elegans]|uniref:uncharacterized protein LOC124171249 n=1 Tax=Ischnura elegans TaxID=197161 RepID=UPI001ED89A9D|nr:uncharacterized protein LOC124171249 [Ischnura elegans]
MIAAGTSDEARSEVESLTIMPRGDRSETSASVRGQMVGMKNAGCSTAEVAANFGVHPNTVLKWVRRAREDEDLQSRERSGRPRCTNIEDDERMHQAILNEPLRAGGAAAVKRELMLGCSNETVRRRLRERGIFHRQPARKPFLTPEHKARRVRFAETYVDVPQTYWDLCIFSDEKTFSSDADGMVKLWRPTLTR